MTVVSNNPDTAFFTNGEGITRVSLERWREAQKAECDLWMREGVWWVEDRNSLHAERFGGYTVLRERRFSHALEVGCGPFGNLRLIAKECSIEKVSLLDPLLSQYIYHPASRCSSKGLIIDANWPPTMFRNLCVKVAKKSALMGRGLLNLGKLVLPRERIKISEMFSSPAEELNQRQQYDLIVMINVLEHCFDAKAVCQRVRSALRPNGTLVFHDHFYSGDEPLDFYDPFHPLRVSRQVVQSELLQFFTPLYQMEESFKEEPPTESWPAIYFIGKLS